FLPAGHDDARKAELIARLTGATVDAIGVDAVDRAVRHLLPQAGQRDEPATDMRRARPAAAAPAIMTIAS
ncbi:hypothetical protein IAI13_35365, partial [Escherichia coli]|nr:hypothetical protein [Escherichia coli]